MSQEDLRKRLMEPGTWTNKALPPNRAAMGQKWNGGCNTNIPNTNVYERMLWTIQVFISQGMYVILDYQPMVRSRGRAREGGGPWRACQQQEAVKVQGAREKNACSPMLGHDSCMHIPTS
jgi:hypothetical protein